MGLSKHALLQEYCEFKVNEWCKRASNPARYVRCLQRNCSFWKHLNEIVWPKAQKRPVKDTLAEEVPGLDLKRVWWSKEHGHIFPIGSLPKPDRDALKAARYEWAGRWWERYS